MYVQLLYNICNGVFIIIVIVLKVSYLIVGSIYVKCKLIRRFLS